MWDFQNQAGQAPRSDPDATLLGAGWCGSAFGSLTDKALRKGRAKKAIARACGRVIEGLLPLEPRVMLAAGSKATNVVARFDGSIATAGTTQQVSIHINPADFTPTRTGELILGFQVTAADGSPLDPSSVVINFVPLNTLSNHPVVTGIGSTGIPAASKAATSTTVQAGLMTPLYVQPDLAGGNQSLALFNLPYANYTITLGGDRGTSGGWHLDVYLVGDLNGDHAVDRATDSSLIRQAYGMHTGQSGYKLEGDANLDGLIDSTDVALETRNIGAGTTSIVPLTLIAALSPAPTRQLTDGTPLTNQSASGITGLTAPGAKVQLDSHGGITFADGTTTAAADGTYSFPITLNEGLNTLNVRATDRFGQSRQATLKVSLDDIAPLVSPPDLRSTSDSGASNIDDYTNVIKPTLDVQAETGSLVTLLADGQSVGSTTALNGTASFTLTGALLEGIHHFSATATDAAGNVGTSTILDVTVDTLPPPVTLTLDPAFDTAPLGDNHTTLATVTLDGLTEPSTPVTLTQGNLSTTSGADGKFSYGGISLTPGSNVFNATATDLAGNVGTGGLTVTRDATAVEINLLEGTHYHVIYQQTITVPSGPSILIFTFDNLNFDTAARFVKDAFEATLIGSDGTPDTFTIGARHDAYFNMTEGQGTALAKGVNVSPAANGGTTVSVDLSSIPAGSQSKLELRLVNDDSDTTTAVHVSDVHVQAGLLPTGGTTGPVGLPAAFVSSSGTPANPSQPGINVVSTGSAPSSGPVTATSQRPPGPSAPSTTMTLTAAGAAAGFTLSNFATSFPVTAGIVGPLAVAYITGGGVMATDYNGDIRIFPNDAEGQNASAIPVAANYGQGNAIGLAQVGQKFYMTQQTANAVIELNPDGTFKQTILTGVPFATGIVAGPNGHLFVSSTGAILEIDPIAKTKTIFNNAGADGLIISPDGSTLYAAVPSIGDIQGFNLVSKALVFDSGPIPGTIDGLAVGVGALSGRIFVNTNSGTVVQVSLTTSAQTLLSTGGSRGDFVTVDPVDGSLILSQTDRFLRLTAPAGSGFNTLVDVQVTATTPQSHVSAGSTVLISGRATTIGTSITNPAGHGAIVPSTTMKLTQAGTTAGYTLTTFASDFPFFSSGPIGWALLDNGNVMTSDVGGNVRIFPNDNDGQTTAGANIAQNHGANNGDQIAQVGTHIYMALQGSGSVIELNPNGTFNQTIVTGLGAATSMVVGPNGHLYGSNLQGTIFEIDPIAKTSSTFIRLGADGVGFSADGTILYLESGNQIIGLDVTTKAQVFASGVIAGGADGMAVGVGALAGSIFVNANDGTLVQIDIATKTQTLLATGGSRGDLVAIDPSDGSLMLTQTDRILRLIPPPGSGFGNVFPSTIKSVTINGVPVDALDNNGNFFAHVPVQPGPNGYVVLATDSGRQTAFVTLNITGDTASTTTTTNVVDLSGSLTPKFGRTSLNEKTGVLFTQVAALNAGQFGVNKPLFVGVTNLSNPTVSVLNPDGYTDTGIPYFDYSTLVAGNHLEPGQQTGFRELSFSNPGKVQFTFDLVPLGVLNSPPLITSLPITEVVAGKPYQYAVTATDPDKDPLTFSLATAPAGMSIDPVTGLITYSSATAGIQDVLIAVSDGRGGTAQQRYQLNVIVAPSNRPPVFVTGPVVDATAGKPYAYASKAVDPDGDPVTYALIATNYNLPLQAVPIVINPGFEMDVLPDGGFRGGAIGWNLLSGGGGAYNPTVINFPSVPEGQNVFFSNGSTISQVLTTPAIAGDRYTLQVQVGWSFNQPFPGYAVQLWAGGTMLGQATGPVPVQGSFVNAVVDVTVNPGNAGLGQALEIRLIGNGVQEEFDDVRLTSTPPSAPVIPVPAGVSVDPNTGIITWSPTLAQTGPNTMTIQAADGKGGTALQTYVVNVASGVRVPVTNRPPIIISTPPVGPAVVAVPYVYAVKALDPDNDALTYSIPTPPLGMTINPTTGLLTWSAPASLVGTVHVVVVVNDGRGGSANQAFDLSVVASAANAPPTITSAPPTSAEATKLYIYQVEATDPNADPLQYSLTTAPTGMVIDPASGLIRWLPLATDIGFARQVVISVNDGRGGIVTQTFGISVFSQVPNHPPQITSTAPLTAVTGQLYRYDAIATDPDHDLLIWSLDIAPVGMVVDSATGTLVWQPQANQLGTQSVVLHVSDAHGGEVTQSFDITLSTVNHPPGIISAPPTAATVTKAYIYAVAATDPEGDAIIFSLRDGPIGMTIDPATGLISWLPTVAQIGSNNVIVRATDTHGAFGEQTYGVVVSVSADNRPPTITSTPPFVAEPAKPYNYAVTAVDPDRDVLHYALLTGPSGMTIDGSTGQVAWTPAAAQVGTFTVSVAAIDTSNARMVQTYNVVTRANHPPVITSLPSVSVTAGVTYHYTVKATDPDNDPLAIHLDTAPTGMTVDAFGNISWSPAVGDIGPHAVQLTVKDPHGATATQSFAVTVTADTTAPKIQIIVDHSPVNINELVRIQVDVVDGVGVSQRTLLVDGQPVALDINGTAAVKINHAGDITLTATATDAAGNVATATGDFIVIDPTNVSAPFVQITSPGDGSQIRSVADVIGTVTDSHLLFYTLSIAPADGTGNFKEIFRGTNNVTNAKIGSFDPTLLANDTYILRLDAENTGGNKAEADVQLEVSGNLKLGNFTLSFTDMQIPVAGIPITVGRTYDSLDANSQNDFGFGWRLDVGNTRLRTSLAPDPQADIGVYPAFVPGTRVYITLPGGKREGFTFNPGAAPGLKGSFLNILAPDFLSDPDVTDTLSVDPFDIYFNANLGHFSDYYGDLPYNPADPNFGSGNYTLTTKDGYVYHIDGNTGGLHTVSDPHGNTLTFTDNGITSSGGAGVTITRDPKGRITSVTDLRGKSINYAYSALGDLASVTDRDKNVTAYQYNTTVPHYLQKVIDPLGRTGIRSEYGADGRLTRIINASGNQVVLNFDSGSRTETTTDPLGNKTTTIYDGSGNALQVLDAAGNLTKRTFNAAGNMLTETDPLGHTTTRTYDNRSNLLSVTDPLGHSTTYIYDNFSKPLTETDALGHKIVRTFDRGEMTSQTNAAGDVIRSTYDNSGKIKSVTDGEGNSIQYAYGSNGYVAAMARSDGSGNTIGSDANGNIISDTQFTVGHSGTSQATTSYSYDNNGSLTGETNQAGDSLALKVDPLNHLTGSTDALGRPWAYTYNNSGQITGQLAPDGTSTQVTYDLDGRESSVVGPDGGIVHFEYDALGRRTKTIMPDGTFDAQSYDAAGRITSTTSLSGVTTLYTYDAAGHMLTETAPGDIVTTYTYDAVGNRTSITDALGGVTNFDYDNANRLAKTTFPDGTFMLTTYNHNGQVASLRDANGAIWRYTYNATNLLTGVTSPDGLVTAYRYDSNQRLETIADSAGHETVFTYDVNGRRTGRTLAGGATETYTYNAEGRPTSITDAAGIITNLSYDAQGNVTTRAASNGETENRTYDANNRLTGVTNALGGTVLAYDAFGHVTSWKGPAGNVLAYAYDADGRLASIATAAGTTVQTFDAQGGIATIKGIDGATTTYTRDALGRATNITLPGGAAVSKSYDTNGRTSQITNKGAGAQATLSLTYTRDSVGRITTIAEGGGRVVEYTYDINDRITTEKITTPGTGVQTFTYAYDGLGNLVSRADSQAGTVALVHNIDNQVVSDGTAAYSWNVDGSLASRTEGGVTERFTYDARNRLIKLERLGAASGPAVILYEYDFHGLMSARIVDGVRTNFTWDRTSFAWPLMLEERNGFGGLVRHYEYANGVLQRSIDGTGNVQLYATDHLGTIRAVTSVSGVTLQTYNYDAYGRPLDVATAVIAGPGYIGGWTDPVTGLVYLQNRWYSPRVASFIQSDQANPDPSDPRTLNRYVYSVGDPVNRMDPTGKFSLGELAVTVAILGLGETFVVHSETVKEVFLGALKLIKAFKNWDNPTAEVTPIISATIPAAAEGILAVAAGLEGLRFTNHIPEPVAIYFYFGIGIGTPTGASGSIGTLSPGIVFDTRDPDDYKGWFFSLSLSGGISNLLKLGSSQYSASVGGSVFWSPIKTYHDTFADVDRYSHGLGAGSGIGFSANTPGEDSALSWDFRLNLTYYFLITRF